MKKVIFTLTIVCLSSIFAFAQNSGRGFNYQAIARDINGQVIQNEMIILQFGLYPGQYSTEPTWQELQLATTDEFGAFSLTVGHGQQSGGTVNNFEELDYGAADYWLKVELKDGEEFYEISFRELLSVPYAEVARNAMPNPVGTILPFAGPTNAIPEGYLLCNGASLDKNAYPELYAVIGNAWGGNTINFNLPDCRGMFLRGVAGGSTSDPDRGSRTASATGGNTGDNVGSKQLTATKKPINFAISNAGSHTHAFTDAYFSEMKSSPGTWLGSSGHDHDNEPYEYNDVTASSGSHSHNTTGWDNESRPINIYVNYIIKY